MRRDIDSNLLNWKDKNRRKPLIVRGARQVGKTYSISQFGINHFTNFVKLDFERDLSLIKLFEKDLSPKALISKIELHVGRKITPGKTLLFFDEIQVCERALLSLRYFYEEMSGLHVIAAGSMLEFALKNISFPVGRVSFEWMYPMKFKEYLIAAGKELLSEAIPNISNFTPVSEFTHALIMEQLRVYFNIGGMPEAVKQYIETDSFLDIPQIHEEILYSYFQSLTKYSKRADIESLDHVMKTIPKYVGSQLKYKTIDPDRRIEKTKSAIKILEKALIIHLIHSSDATGLPLGATSSIKIFKSLFLDIGLMQYSCGIDAKTIINEKNLSKIYKGALVEQFVGQELLSSGGYENRKLYYWSRRAKNSSAEIDFLFVKDGRIFPVEVKSGPAGKLKSLHLYLETIENSTMGYVLSPSTFKKQRVNNMLFYPFYTELS